jgi:hypothetical protein
VIPQRQRWAAWFALGSFSLCLCCGGCGPQQSVTINDFLNPNPTPAEAVRLSVDEADADERRRGISLLASSYFGGEPEYVELYRLIATDPDPTVRAACIKALGLHGSVEDVPRLIEALGDADASVRWEAAKALQKIHDPQAVRPLIEAMQQDPDSDVRMASAIALGQYPQPGVFTALVGALSDRAFGVVDSARTSLVLLTGQDFGYNGRAWLDWSAPRGGNLFQDQQPYTYKPFEKPRGFFDWIAFWSPRQDTSPRRPKGLPGSEPAKGQESADETGVGS